jgi:hypothetical protein
VVIPRLASHDLAPDQGAGRGGRPGMAAISFHSCPHAERSAGPRRVVDCRALALVAQRIEHLTTDRFAVPAVLTRENASNDRPVCTESEAQVCSSRGYVLGCLQASAEGWRHP